MIFAATLFCSLNSIYNLVTHQGELPDTLAEWKALVHERFPVVYDTKVLGSTRGHLDTSLGELYKAATASEGGPAVAADPAAVEYVSRDGQHEAGFDAWLTGSVFARLGGRELLADPANKLQNRLNMGRSLHNLNLAGEDELIGGAIFHASGFAEEVKTGTLVAFFGAPLHVRGVPSDVTAEQFETELAKFGALDFFVLAANPDGKSPGSGFAAFKETTHAEAAIAALHGTGHFGGDGKLEVSALRVSVQWVDNTSAYLILPLVSDSEGAALLKARSEAVDFKVVTLAESKHGGAAGRILTP